MLVRAQGLLFDIDGTIIDSARAVDLVWSRWGQTHGVDVSEILSICHGRRTTEVVSMLAPDLDAGATAKIIEDQIVAAGGKPTPGAADLLESLPSGRWGVVTSSLATTAARRFDRLPVPTMIVSGSDVERGKPDPTGFLLGAQRLGVQARDCVAFEDSPQGVEAGLCAGMIVIAVATTHPVSALLRASIVIPNLEVVEVRQIPDGSLEVNIADAAILHRSDPHSGNG